MLAEADIDPLNHAELCAIAAEPYERRGILHSEMALIIHTCRHYGIEMVIESGLEAGDSVVLSGQINLTDSTRIKAIAH